MMESRNEHYNARPHNLVVEEAGQLKGHNPGASGARGRVF